MESFEERYARQMKEREEQLQQAKLEQQLSLIMSPDDDELDNQLMIGCCLKIKK